MGLEFLRLPSPPPSRLLLFRLSPPWFTEWSPGESPQRAPKASGARSQENERGLSLKTTTPSPSKTESPHLGPSTTQQPATRVQRETFYNGCVAIKHGEAEERRDEEEEWREREIQANC